MGGYVCQDAQWDNCTGIVSSVEMLDVSIGTWQPFAVPLGRATEFVQSAMLDDELGALQGMYDTVNDCLFRTVRLIRSSEMAARSQRYRYSITLLSSTILPFTLALRDTSHACYTLRMC